MTEIICSTDRPAIPRPNNLSRVIGMVLGGDLHDATVLLAQGGMMKSFSGRCVARWLMGRLLRRSRMHLNQLDIPAALDSIDDAKMVAGPAGQRWVAIRLANCLEKIMRQCNRLLKSGNCQPLGEILEELGRRGLLNQDTERLLELARIAIRSEILARQEQWGAAIGQLEKLRHHSPPVPWFSPRMKWLRDRQTTSGLNETNSDLLSSTIVISDIVATSDSAAKRGLARGPVQLPSFGPADNAPALPKRLLLWIDGIGHYLLCLESEIWIGRYVPLSGIQIPLLADIGRRHVRLFRDGSGEGSIQAHWPTSLVSNELASYALNPDSQSVLVSGSLLTLELGEQVELEYFQPEQDRPVMIRPVSGHRTVPAANAVVWVDRRLTIGGHADSDIQCPNRTGKIEIEFGEAGVFVTGAERIVVPAATGSGGTAPGQAGIRISSSDISLVLEPLESGQEIPFAGSLQPKSLRTKPVSGNRDSFRIE